MMTALAIIGIVLIFASVQLLMARLILWAYAPEVGSNAHLREWLFNNPGKDLSDYPRTDAA